GLSGELSLSTGDATDNTINISTGNNDTTISASGDGDVVSVNAEDMAAGTTLDLSGSADFAVSDVVADMDASGTSGEVSVSYGEVGGEASIESGSGSLTIGGGGSGDTLNIDASLMGEGEVLSSSGAADQEVSGVVGDISASGLEGDLIVTTGDAEDGEISITLGSGDAVIVGSGLDDTISISGDVMLEGSTLELGGVSSFEVSGLEGNADLSGASGEVSLSTSDAADDQISITLGSGDTTIVGSGLDDTISINGDVMLDSATLELSGVSSFEVSGLTGNADLSGASGAVSLSYGDVGDGVAEITLGSGSSSVSGSDAGDRLEIDASSLSEEVTLSSSGAADQVVSGVVGDISASGLSGELSLSTGDATDDAISISTGSNDTTISASGDGDVVSVNAEDMAAGTTLDLSGSAEFAITDVVADMDASGTSGDVSVSYGEVGGEASIESGSGSLTIGGGGSGDMLAIDASRMAEGEVLSSSGAASQEVSGVVADITASGLSGELSLSTGDATDNTINISTGNNDTTISASGDGDVVSVNAEDMAAGTTLDLSGSAEFAITDVVADMD
ncbi:MAG: beta strand repeat-containing protein, partial [Cyanobacteriota bacterium]